MWPPDETLLAAWTRLVADPDTAGAFAELVLAPLHADILRQYPLADPNDVVTAVDESLLWLIRNPTRFDPSRSLPGFLRMAARRDLLNLVDANARKNRGRIPWENVELAEPHRNEEEEHVSLAELPEVRAVIDALPEADRRVYDLMCDGERSTAVFAHALGLADRSPDDQFAEVKRAKDRVKQRLKRAGGGG